jgi:hypothetical protein
MRLGMMVSFSILCAAALIGCQSSHPTTKPTGGAGSSDDCDCCPPAKPAAAALAPAGAAAAWQVDCS